MAIKKERCRRIFSPIQKFEIVKEQLTSKVPVQTLCRKYGISRTLFYSWQNQFFCGAGKGFEKNKSHHQAGTLDQFQLIENKSKQLQLQLNDLLRQNIMMKKMFWGYSSPATTTPEMRALLVNDIALQSLQLRKNLEEVLQLYGIKRSTYYDWKSEVGKKGKNQLEASVHRPSGKPDLEL